MLKAIRGGKVVTYGQLSSAAVDAMIRDGLDIHVLDGERVTFADLDTVAHLGVEALRGRLKVQRDEQVGRWRPYHGGDHVPDGFRACHTCGVYFAATPGSEVRCPEHREPGRVALVPVGTRPRLEFHQHRKTWATKFETVYVEPVGDMPCPHGKTYRERCRPCIQLWRADYEANLRTWESASLSRAYGRTRMDKVDGHVAEGRRATRHGGGYADPTADEALDNLAEDDGELLIEELLSRREAQVIGMLRDRWTQAQIAAELAINPSTVDTYQRRAEKKFTDLVGDSANSSPCSSRGGPTFFAPV